MFLSAFQDICVTFFDRDRPCFSHIQIGCFCCCPGIHTVEFDFLTIARTQKTWYNFVPVETIVSLSSLRLSSGPIRRHKYDYRSFSLRPYFFIEESRSVLPAVSTDTVNFFVSEQENTTVLGISVVSAAFDRLYAFCNTLLIDGSKFLRRFSSCMPLFSDHGPIFQMKGLFDEEVVVLRTKRSSMYIAGTSLSRWY